MSSSDRSDSAASIPTAASRHRLSSHLDGLCLAAARAACAPIAGITLVDGPWHWIRSAVGFGLSQRPRPDHLVHALVDAAERVHLVADTRHSDGLSRSPLVDGPPFIRSFAGIMLRAEDGTCLGMIFIGDRVPRTFLAAEVEPLETVAACLETLFALRDEVGRLSRSASTA